MLHENPVYRHADMKDRLKKYRQQTMDIVPGDDDAPTFQHLLPHAQPKG